MNLVDLFESQNDSKKPVVLESNVFKVKQLINECINIIENNFVYDNGIDFEEQPKFQGIKGKSSDVGYGIEDAKKNKHTIMTRKLNATWRNLLSKLKNLNSDSRVQVNQYLTRLVSIAHKHNIELTPSPETIGIKQTRVESKLSKFIKLAEHFTKLITSSTLCEDTNSQADLISKIKATWNQLIKELKKTNSGEEAKRLTTTLTKLKKLATKHGIEVGVIPSYRFIEPKNKPQRTKPLSNRERIKKKTNPFGKASLS